MELAVDRGMMLWQIQAVPFAVQMLGHTAGKVVNQGFSSSFWISHFMMSALADPCCLPFRCWGGLRLRLELRRHQPLLALILSGLLDQLVLLFNLVRSLPVWPCGAPTAKHRKPSSQHGDQKAIVGFGMSVAYGNPNFVSDT